MHIMEVDKKLSVKSETIINCTLPQTNWCDKLSNAVLFNGKLY
jgi:hypothetical protein